MLKFFSGLSLEGWIVTALLVIGLGFVGKYEFNEWQLRKAQETVHDQKITIASQKDAIKTDGKVADLNNQVQKETQEAVHVTVDKHEKIQQKMDQATRVIEAQYERQPVTIDNIDLEQRQLSEVRINGLWEAYCAAAPGASECQAKTADLTTLPNITVTDADAPATQGDDHA